MKRYYSTSAYAAQFDPSKLFATTEDARAFDRAFAAAFIGRTDAGDVNHAFAGRGVTALRQVIAFLADELPFFEDVAEAPREEGITK
jgi:hypothetical protein